MAHSVLVEQGEDSYIEGRNRGIEPHYAVLLPLLLCLGVPMVEDMPDNAVYAECRLYDVRSEPLSVHGDLLGPPSDHIVGDSHIGSIVQ